MNIINFANKINGTITEKRPKTKFNTGQYTIISDDIRVYITYGWEDKTVTSILYYKKEPQIHFETENLTKTYAQLLKTIDMFKKNE